MLSFSCVFAGRLLVHCCVFQISCIQGTTPYPVSCRTLGFLQFHPWTSIILTRTELVLLLSCSVREAVLCLPRFWAPQSVVLTTGPSHMSAKSAAKPAAQVQPSLQPSLQLQSPFQ